MNSPFGPRKNKPNQSQPVVSLPALSAIEGAEPVSNGPFTHGKDKDQIIDFSA
jgi:hypothetical protein